MAWIMVSREQQRRLLIMPGWPMGFCPIHVDEGLPCNSGCLATREAFAVSANELAAYFPVWDRIHHRTPAESKVA